MGLFNVGKKVSRLSQTPVEELDIKETHIIY
jgi:hypothetical protein